MILLLYSLLLRACGIELNQKFVSFLILSFVSHFKFEKFSTSDSNQVIEYSIILQKNIEFTEH